MMQGTLRLTEKGWEAVRTRALAKVPDEFGPNPCPGTLDMPCGVRTMNALCHFCTRTIDRALPTVDEAREMEGLNDAG